MTCQFIKKCNHTKYLFNLISHIYNCNNIKSDIKYSRKSKQKSKSLKKYRLQIKTSCKRTHSHTLVCPKASLFRQYQNKSSEFSICLQQHLNNINSLQHPRRKYNSNPAKTPYKTNSMTPKHVYSPIFIFTKQKSDYS